VFLTQPLFIFESLRTTCSPILVVIDLIRAISHFGCSQGVFKGHVGANRRVALTKSIII